MIKLLTLSSLLLSSLLLQGCAPLLIAGAAAGATLANDRRSATAIFDDQGIENHVRRQLKDDSGLAHDTHISVTSFNRVLLLTGQVRDNEQWQQAAELARGRNDIKRIHNEIILAAPIPRQARNQDAWLTTKVKNALLRHPSLNAMQIKVISEDSTVYLMGLVTPAEGHAAATTAQQVDDVRAVIKVFEYID